MTGLAVSEGWRTSSSIPAFLNAYERSDGPTLAEALRRRGYSTRAIVGNHLLSRPLRVADGFQWIDTYGERGMNPWIAAMQARWGSLSNASTRVLTDQAIRWAAETGSDRSFLWLHYFDPHDPYDPPQAYLNTTHEANRRSARARRRLYDGEVRYVDAEIGRFLNALQKAGRYDDSIIVLASDHGEGFLEHGTYLHGGDLYQELLHVPLFIRMPHGKFAGKVAAYVPTRALLPTLLDLAGISEDPADGWTASLAPLIRGTASDYDWPIISGANLQGEPQWSILIGGKKYIHKELSGAELVYDLPTDPGEQHPLKSPPEKFVAQARLALDGYHAANHPTDTRDEDPQERELQRRLKSLGYIQ